MKYLFITLMTLSSGVQAFTLNNNFGGAFKSNKVNVYVESSTTCGNAGITADDWNGLVKPAVEKFWNKIPTSSLRLKFTGFDDPVGASINTDRLCAPTDDDCIATPGPGASVIEPVKDILIACNDNALNYGNSSNVLAVTVPNSFSGRSITGAVILINDMAGTAFADLSKSDQISVIAHEIGHAIGLGHSEGKEALMYYKTVNLRKRLGQDDIDGVSYLYPVKLDGCGLLGGTIDTKRPGPPFWQMGLGFGLMIILFEMRRLLKRPKACAPA